MKYDSKADTLDHIRRVNSLLLGCCANLQMRAHDHDQGKLVEPEKSVFDENTEKLRGLTYGSDEYKASLAALGPALQHHYAHNSHHPEHYDNGVAGMSLFACPFCGELPEYEPWAQGHAPGYAWPHQIVHNCKIIGQQICVRAHKSGMPDTKESVFSIWNTRAAGRANDAQDDSQSPAKNL